jgi:hypothetical protein
MNFRTIIQFEDIYISLTPLQPCAPQSNMKLRTRIIPTFLTASLLTASLAAEAQGLVVQSPDILSTYPVGSGSASFYIGTDSAANYEGGAAGFTPQQDYSLTSATVELSGYNGAYGQLASIGIYSDLSEPYNPVLPDQPGSMLIPSPMLFTTEPSRPLRRVRRGGE